MPKNPSVNSEEVMDRLLIKAYKEKGSDTALLILVERYRGFSFMLAETIKQAFGNKYYIEIDDLVSIGLTSVTIAVKKFDGNSPFYPYWKQIAENNMNKHVQQEINYHEFVRIMGDGIGYLDSDVETSFGSSDTLDRESLIKQVIDYMSKQEGTKKIDLEIYRLYLDNVDVTSIAKILNLKYSYVRKKIKILREKVLNYLQG